MWVWYITGVGVVVVGSVSPEVTLSFSIIQLNLVQMEREMRLKELEQLIKEATLVRYVHTWGVWEGRCVLVTSLCRTPPPQRAHQASRLEELC